MLLRDVLLDAGINEDDEQIKHVQFEGYDQDIAGEHYGASIPIDIAMRPGGDVLLAYEMNGEELPRDHGHPVRVVVPGVVGARNVKWLKTITVSKEECSSFFQSKDYKTTSPSAKWEGFDFCRGDAYPIYFSPVQSAICSPREGSILDDDEEEITVKGYAFSGGGSGILRVDVSIDNGTTWHLADLEPSQKQKSHGNWAWTRWQATVPIPVGKDRRESFQIHCKAIDTSHNVQPEKIAGIWNLRGFLNNSWHSVTISTKQSKRNEIPSDNTLGTENNK